MAIFDRQYMKDMRAILDKASVLKVEPKQPKQNNHAAPYVAPVDYGMYSCSPAPIGHVGYVWTDTAPSEYNPPDFDGA